jgi:hypothetical protein
MLLCAKCHQNGATVHFTTVVEGLKETIHLCEDCAPGFNYFKELGVLPVGGKKCEFCGKEAFSGVRTTWGSIGWCFNCGLEFMRILADMCMAERPDLMPRSREESVSTELQAWNDAASQRAAEVLKERRRQDGRDKGS